MELDVISGLLSQGLFSAVLLYMLTQERKSHDDTRKVLYEVLMGRFKPPEA